jgi:hypothetical protein
MQASVSNEVSCACNFATLSNINPIIGQKVGNTLQFRGLIGGEGINISQLPTELVLSTPIFRMKNALFVSPLATTLGQREYPSIPFGTIQEAVFYATMGDIIIVQSGNYTINSPIILPINIIIYFEPNTNITSTCAFSAENKTISILGYANFIGGIIQATGSQIEIYARSASGQLVSTSTSNILLTIDNVVINSMFASENIKIFSKAITVNSLIINGGDVFLAADEIVLATTIVINSGVFATDIRKAILSIPLIHCFGGTSTLDIKNIISSTGVIEVKGNATVIFGGCWKAVNILTNTAALPVISIMNSKFICSLPYLTSSQPITITAMHSISNTLHNSITISMIPSNAVLVNSLI